MIKSLLPAITIVFAVALSGPADAAQQQRDTGISRNPITDFSAQRRYYRSARRPYYRGYYRPYYRGYYRPYRYYGYRPYYRPYYYAPWGYPYYGYRPYVGRYWGGPGFYFGW
jgi:hypothetical protein